MKTAILVAGLIAAHWHLAAATYTEMMNDGEKYRKAGDLTHALESYHQAAGGALDLGQSARAWYRIGQVLEQQQEWEAADQAYLQSLERMRYPETEQAIARIESRNAGRVVPAGEIAGALKTAAKRSQVLVPSVNLFVNFDFDKDTLTTDGMAQVEELSKALTDPSFGDARFELVGHTDQVGTDLYNLGLSERRATRVREVLVSRFGAARAKFDVKGMGKRQLLSTGDSEADHRLNRRVEVRLLNGASSTQ